MIPVSLHTTIPRTGRRDWNSVDRRRLVALAGHRGDAVGARSALTDPSASVRATALGALERLGALADDDLRDALDDPDGSVRRRAAELAATRPGGGRGRAARRPGSFRGGDGCLVPRGARGADSGGMLSALASTATGHRDPLCREAAVAALGAIGDAAGLPAVLAALDDKPAVRRRAAVALAAFEGPSVEAALRQCLETETGRSARSPRTCSPSRESASVARPASSGLGCGEDGAQTVEGVEAHPGARSPRTRGGGHQMDGHLGLVGQAVGQAPKERPSPHQVDPLIDDVLGQFGW